MRAVQCSKEGRTTDVFGRLFRLGPVLPVSGLLHTLLADEEKMHIV